MSLNESFQICRKNVRNESPKDTVAYLIRPESLATRLREPENPQDDDKDILIPRYLISVLDKESNRYQNTLLQF